MTKDQYIDELESQIRDIYESPSKNERGRVLLLAGFVLGLIKLLREESNASASPPESPSLVGGEGVKP